MLESDALRFGEGAGERCWECECVVHRGVKQAKDTRHAENQRQSQTVRCGCLRFWAISFQN